jgi:GrpB-like predicted nucleotidyltransferase (UPF0157 family)
MEPHEPMALLDDPVWTDRFEHERDRVELLAADGLLGVCHVGSTAIPDVAGVPCLDVLAVYEDEAAVSTAAAALSVGAYDLDHESEGCAVVTRWGEDHAVFCKLHRRGDERVRNQLLFRDYLRETPAARRRYEAVKREAHAEHPEGASEYTAAKHEVVTELLGEARERGYGADLPGFA